MGAFIFIFIAIILAPFVFWCWEKTGKILHDDAKGGEDEQEEDSTWWF